MEYNTDKIFSKWLNPCCGFYIDKSWKVKPDGKIDPKSIVYTVYEDMEGDFLDCFDTLKKAKEYCKQEKEGRKTK